MSKPVQGIVFGSSRSGKSNLINQLTQKEELIVSNLQYGVTSECKSVTCNKNETEFLFWDTPGLFETGYGAVPNKDAVLKILLCLKEIQKNDILSFVIFVFKDTLKENDAEYLKLFKSFLNKKTKIIIVMTHQADYVSQEDPSNECFEPIKKAINKSLNLNYDFIPVSYENFDNSKHLPEYQIKIEKNKYKSNDSIWRSLSSFYDSCNQTRDRNTINNSQSNGKQIIVRNHNIVYLFISYIFINYKFIFQNLKKEKELLRKAGFDKKEISDIIEKNKLK